VRDAHSITSSSTGLGTGSAVVAAAAACEQADAINNVSPERANMLMTNTQIGIGRSPHRSWIRRATETQAPARITLRVIATALLALTIGGSPAAQATEHNGARPRPYHMTLTHHDVPPVARTGLGDMDLTHKDAPRVVRTGLGDMTLTPVSFRSTSSGDVSTRMPPPISTQTPDRTPWLLIIAPVLLAATVTGQHYLARRRRSGSTT
jgi:hypothetical protein